MKKWMFEKKDCLKARSDITAFSALDDDLCAFSTAIHGIKVFSSDSCGVTNNFKIELLGYKTTAIAFSKDSNLLAFANSNIIYIMNRDSKMVVQTIRTNEGVIDMISFIPNSVYLVTGTQHGRVMQYRYDGRAGLSRLCSFGHSTSNQRSSVKNSYVSAFACTNEYLAFSGYGGLITILKMNSHANKQNIEASKVRINALCFLTDGRIVSGNIDGLIQIHPLRKYQKTEVISTPFININAILVMPNPRYLMVSGEATSVIIIDTQTAKVVSAKYLSFKGNVSRISLSHDKDLLVVLDDKKIIKVKLPTAEDLKSFILHNQLDKAYELLEADPMLNDTREHKRVEVMYEIHYSQAIEALSRSNAREARKLMKTFSEIKSKKDDVSAIFKAFEFYSRFKTLYADRKYSLSYALAEKHPALKHTVQYKKMEEDFKDAFSFAQKQVLTGNPSVAKEVLAGFLTVVSKKPLLDLILNQNRDFISFIKAINAKDVKSINALLNKNKIFSQVPTYKAMKDSSQKSLDEIRTAINIGNVNEAVEKIKKLTHYPALKDELQELYGECKLVKNLQQKYEEGDFKSCYEILDSSLVLDNIELSKLLEKHWAKLMNECEEHALKGDIKSIKKVLGELISVNTRLAKTGDLFRVSFHTKMKILLSKKSFKSAENIIYSYIDIFGKDSEVLSIMKIYERVSGKKLAITIDQEKRVPRDGWLNSSLIMD